MTLTIKARAHNALKDGKVSNDEATGILKAVRKDKQVTAPEAEALGNLGKLPKDKFEYESWKNGKSEMTHVAQTAGALLALNLNVLSTVPGVSVALDRKVEIRPLSGNLAHDQTWREQEASYQARALNVTIKGGKVAQAGTLSFTLGDQKLSVAVSKGMTQDAVFARVRSELAKTQGDLESSIPKEATRLGARTATFYLHQVGDVGEPMLKGPEEFAASAGKRVSVMKHTPVKEQILDSAVEQLLVQLSDNTEVGDSFSGNAYKLEPAALKALEGKPAKLKELLHQLFMGGDNAEVMESYSAGSFDLKKLDRKDAFAALRWTVLNDDMAPEDVDAQQRKNVDRLGRALMPSFLGDESTSLFRMQEHDTGYGGFFGVVALNSKTGELRALYNTIIP